MASSSAAQPAADGARDLHAPPAAGDPYASLDDSVRALAERGDQRRYRKGTLLIQEGDFGDTLYIVLSGKVKAFSTDDRDREIVYGSYGPGDYLGEMSLDGGPRAASVMTLEPTVCAVVTRHRLREYIAANPEFAFELLARVIRRARIATRSARSMALLNVYERVVLLLDELAIPRDDGTRVIEQRLTHSDIASRVGCSREMVSRLVKDLQTGRYVAATPDGLTLLQTLPTRW